MGSTGDGRSGCWRWDRSWSWDRSWDWSWSWGWGWNWGYWHRWRQARKAQHLSNPIVIGGSGYTNLVLVIVEEFKPLLVVVRVGIVGVGIWLLALVGIIVGRHTFGWSIGWEWQHCKKSEEICSSFWTSPVQSCFGLVPVTVAASHTWGLPECMPDTVGRHREAQNTVLKRLR